ncbi:NAD-dependent epimerase/dehydratase family protein [Candidatus Nitrosotenuis aquarius]|uniref:NAD-dependent epimerase/dehydratase family protein n=1 Tax=Candidatus Nitrosotenuis aquarius TaxID=1846278 RepID=UPI000C1EE9C3|nr:NAD-dependent epimerase/dehydratase family protein [Candidatus Nitrosotenuis aquarius]
MKITITGGSGFIGSSLVKSLLKEQITIFDTKKPKFDVNFVEGDINNIDNVIVATKDADVVIHLAAALGVINTERNPVKTLDTNIVGTRNVLESCRLNDVKKIIFSSSSEVYGEPIKVPISESDKPIPITTYGISKLAAEEYIKSYSKSYGIRYTILRLFNVYGDEQGTQWVVPEFVSKAVNNDDIIIHGTGSQIRAFCYVTDVADAFRITLEKGDGETFNIGNDKEPISIKNLAERVISLADSKSSIRSIPFEKSDRNRSEIMNRAPNIEKADKLLGYHPVVSLDEGILQIIRNKKPN